jgi:tRNA (guanine9-N1)-methyltransferase
MHKDYDKFIEVRKAILPEKVNKTNIVYLTNESPNVIQELVPEDLYILPGIKDFKDKNLCIPQAEDCGISHARLPYKQKKLGPEGLTINQAFQVIA